MRGETERERKGVKMTGEPLSNIEIREILVATLHGPLPKQTMSRVFVSLAELSTLRDAVKVALKNCYPCAGTSRFSADSDFTG